jgi:hypothetical protein
MQSKQYHSLLARGEKVEDTLKAAEAESHEVASNGVLVTLLHNDLVMV